MDDAGKLSESNIRNRMMNERKIAMNESLMYLSWTLTHCDQVKIEYISSTIYPVKEWSEWVYQNGMFYIYKKVHIFINTSAQCYVKKILHLIVASEDIVKTNVVNHVYQ